jgi:hydroxypyruvate reductase
MAPRRRFHHTRQQLRDTPMPDASALLRRLFDAALAAADPRVVLPPSLPPKPRGRCVVVGAGKSAALMAQVVDQAWPDVALTGIVATRYGHAVPAGRITVLEAGHPVPDDNSQEAARRNLEAVQGLGPDDLVLALISGGGSALLALPAPGLTLADKRGITQRLLHSGASIAEMNVVRRRLSAIKGGSLAASAGVTPVVTLAISDVPGDDPALIASGPTWPDPAAADEAPAILARYGIPVPPALGPHVPRQRRPQDSFQLIATPSLSLRAAATAARAAGLTPLILGDALEGESRELGRVLAGIAQSCQRHGLPAAAPTVLLSGGETTVTIGAEPPGRGGRNTEFLLSLALQLAANPGPPEAPAITALACDTDGIDGTEDAAGAIVMPDTLARARALGLDPRQMLRAHDSYTLFQALGDLIITGPTLTNVNDFRAIMVA